MRRRQKKQPAQVIEVSAHGQLGFDYRLRLSQRKTMGISVREGQVTLAIPVSMPVTDAQAWLFSKRQWVLSKLRLQESRSREIPQRQYADGEQIPWLGKQLTISHLTQRQRVKVRVQRCGDSLHIISKPEMADPVFSQAVERAVSDYYRESARALLTQLTREMCQQLGLPAAPVSLRQTRSKWGHCTPQGNIQYNWLIVLAPEPVVRYLVTHECCHLVHFDHSARFWDLVDRNCPGAGQSRRWLQQNGHRLRL